MVTKGIAKALLVKTAREDLAKELGVAPKVKFKMIDVSALAFDTSITYEQIGDSLIKSKHYCAKCVFHRFPEKFSVTDRLQIDRCVQFNFTCSMCGEIMEPELVTKGQARAIAQRMGVEPPKVQAEQVVEPEQEQAPAAPAVLVENASAPAISDDTLIEDDHWHAYAKGKAYLVVHPQRKQVCSLCSTAIEPKSTALSLRRSDTAVRTYAHVECFKAQ